MALNLAWAAVGRFWILEPGPRFVEKTMGLKGFTH